MDNITPKACLQCQKSLHGRVDKKFCDAYCRNSFNNQHKAVDQQFIQLLNSKIRKNRRILKSLCPSGKATVRKEVLDQMGYTYRLHTETYQSSKGAIYYMCYDFGFTPIYEKSTEKALIIQRQDYMDSQAINLWKRIG